MNERAEPSGGAFRRDADEPESPHRYQTLVNAIDDGVYQLDAEGRFVAVNDVIAEITRYAREELLGKHVSKVVDENVIQQGEWEPAIPDGDVERPTMEGEFRTASGDSVPVEATFSFTLPATGDDDE